MPSNYTALVQQLYLAYLGRPADPAGLASATQALANANAPATLQGLLNSGLPVASQLLSGFSSSAEAQAIYGPNPSSTSLVSAVYQNILGRAPDAAGLAFWTGALNSGQINLANLAAAVSDAATTNNASDAAVVNNRTLLAQAFTSAIDTPAEIAAFTGNNAAGFARQLISSVTANSTVDTAQILNTVNANIGNLVSNTLTVVPAPVAGQPPAPATVPAAPAPAAPAPGPAAPAPTLISTIQGADAASALVGQTVTVQARVTAWQPGLNTFYLQEESADHDANNLTSEGIAVFYGSGGTAPVDANSIGDIVRFTGTVAEFLGATQLTTLSGFKVVTDGTAANLDAARVVTLPYATGTTLERYEGELVTFKAASGNLFVGDAFTFGRFGEFVLNAQQPGQTGAPYNFTQLNDPSVTGLATYNELLGRSQIIIEDNISTQNPSVATYQSTTTPYAITRDINGNGLDGADVLSSDNYLRVGDNVASVTGVLSSGQYSSPAVVSYELLPTAQVNLTPNLRPTGPDTAAINANGTAEIRVATFNVLNYFTTLGDSVNFTTAAGNTIASRGASNATEFGRQQERLVNAVLATGADVLGLNEVQNNGFADGTSALDNLVDQLNARLVSTGSADRFAYVSGPFTNSSGNLVNSAGSDAITVAFIYKTNVVQTLGSAFTPDIGVYDAFANSNRVPLAQTFAYRDDASKQVTLVANHFKSKGGGTNNFAGDAEQNDGQGLFAPTRLEAAVQLADWLRTNPTGATDGDYLLLGDFNSYAREDAIRFLTDTTFDASKNFGGYDIPTANESLVGTYTNLSPNTDYGYVFDGLRGSLDHVFASKNLAAGAGGEITGLDHFHINAAEQTVLDYNTEFNQVGLFNSTSPFRASDHDPVIIGLRLNSEAGSPVNAAPTLRFSNPLDNAVDVANFANIVLTFSEVVRAGTGNIVLTNEGDSSTVTIAVTDTTQVSFVNGTVTINPTANLAGAAKYNVQLAPGVIVDATGLAYAGILDGDTLDFTTAAADVLAPTLASSNPLDNTTNVLEGSNIVLTFSEAVQAGSGSIVLNGIDPATADVTIAINSSQVTIAGSTVTINPTASLESGKSYAVRFGAGVILDASGNSFAGLLDDTALDFTTATSYYALAAGSLAQDWSNAGLITTNNDWTGVPFITGYRGDNITGVSPAGTDPQMLLGEGTIFVNVTANQTDAQRNTTGGGIFEFALTNPVVAFQGSGTADAPNLLIKVNATGRQDITVSYNLRDIDGLTADNSVQPVALQYRIGESGDFINVPAAFVADASTGPSLATLVTAVTAVLPAAVNGAAQLQIRIITSDAVGSDELIGVDDIVISSIPTGGAPAPAPAVNVAPEGANNTLTLNEDTVRTFTAADFGFGDAGNTPPNTLAAVRISSLPANGALSYNNVAITPAQVTAGYEVLVANLGLLAYAPAANANGASYASFTFQVRDNGGTANSGVDLDQSPNTITFNVTAVNDAPTLAGVPVAAQAITAGQAAALADFTVADVDTTNLMVTLTTTNGALNNLTDADGVTAGIQLAGLATDINAAIAGASFTATAAGTASIGISVSDGEAAAVTGTYSFNAAAAGDVTAPTLASSSPMDNGVNVAVGTNIELVFNEAIKAGSGNIVITGAGAAADYTISISDATQVTISGNSLLINPTLDLTSGAAYDVQFAAGVVTDIAGNSFAGLLTADVLNFATAAAAVAMTKTYTENFDTLAITGTSSTLPSGWLLSESGTGAVNITYTAGTGSSTTGDTYSFGSAGSTDRAFGGLQSGTLAPTIGAMFVNTTGQIVNGVDIAYTGEQWRLGALGRNDRLDFQYSTTATDISLATGAGFVDFDALDFIAPVSGGTTGLLDGNAIANRTAITASVTGLNLAAGATLYVRWTDLNATSSDDGLAIDDFLITLTGTP